MHDKRNSLKLCYVLYGDFTHVNPFSIYHSALAPVNGQRQNAIRAIFLEII